MGREWISGFTGLTPVIVTPEHCKLPPSQPRRNWKRVDRALHFSHLFGRRQEYIEWLSRSMSGVAMLAIDGVVMGLSQVRAFASAQRKGEPGVAYRCDGL
jgi:hypothetical protein